MTTLDTNTIAKGTTQYSGFEFESMARFGQKYIGVNKTGMFLLGADNDDGTPIDAIFELPVFDFGAGANSRLRYIYLGGELYGNMRVTLYCDSRQVGRTYSIPSNTLRGRQGVRVPIGRDGKGRYWRFVLTNTNGCDFSIDAITALPIVLHRGHSAL